MNVSFLFQLLHLLFNIWSIPSYIIILFGSLLWVCRASKWHLAFFSYNKARKWPLFSSLLLVRMNNLIQSLWRLYTPKHSFYLLSIFNNWTNIYIRGRVEPPHLLNVLPNLWRVKLPPSSPVNKCIFHYISRCK